MIVNEQKPIIFINDCDCLVDDRELARAILWFSSKPVTRFKKIYLHGKYPAVSIYDQKAHIHRLLVMYRVGHDLDPTLYVHHKDGNKLNALSDNLEIMPAKTHQSKHNKGRVFTPDHRSKLSEANRRRYERWGALSKPVYENGDLLPS